MDKTKCIAALFDFDGVVMDTEPQYTVFWDAVGKKYHPEYEAFGKIAVILPGWRKSRRKLRRI